MAAQSSTAKLGSQGPGLSCGQAFLTLVPVRSVQAMVAARDGGYFESLVWRETRHG